MSEREARRPCPVCPGILLSKMRITNEFSLDFCRRCGGFWFERGEIRLLQAYRPQSLMKRIELADEVYRMNCHSCHQLMPRNDSRCPSCNWANVLNCPECNRKMEVAAHENLQLDICRHCKGVWFDEIELSELWNLNFDAMTRERQKLAGRPTMLGEGAELFLDVMVWHPELMARGAGALMQAGGALFEAAKHMDKAPEVAGNVLEMTGDLAGKVFETIAEIISSILD